MEEIIAKKYILKPGHIVTIMYGALILVGAILLRLNFSHNGHVSFIDALFVSVSAVCVTGLTPVNTALQWTIVGKTIIMILIQIGGLGIMTVAFILAIIMNNKISLRQRTIMQDVTNAFKIKGVVKFSKFIFLSTLFIELMGAVILLFSFIKEGNILSAIYKSIFYSISAFCNAGFDLTGSSLEMYKGNIIINIVIPLLIVIGGIGFFTLKDIYKNKFDVRKYSLQTKIVLTTTFILLFLPMIYFYFIEFKRPCWSDMSQSEKIMASIFQTITPRTAGFNTVSLTKLSQTATLLMVLLMIVGGAPTSTAGGFKVTTFFVLLITIKSIILGKNDTECYNHRLSDEVSKKSIALFTTFGAFTMIGAVLIANIENIGLLDSLYETASAIGTVGLTKNITPILTTPSKVILIFLMFFGRIGCITFLSSFRFVNNKNNARYPIGDVTLG